MTAHTVLQRARGATAAVAAYLAAAGELIVDTTLLRIVMGDGTTTGGLPGALAWQSPTLQNSWVAFGGTKQGPRFRRSLLGEVTVEGAVKSGSVSLTILTLPANYRPAADLDFVCWGAAGPFKVTVQSDGQVIPTAGDATESSLSGIRFWI